MLMNLGGVVQDLPVYNQEGNLFEFTPEFDLNDTETCEAQELLKLTREELVQVEQISKPLEISDDVNVYDYQDGPYYSVMIYGGDNGTGLWSNYLQALHDLLLRLEARFQDVWIIKLDIDTLDDVFDAEIGIMPYTGQLTC